MRLSRGLYKILEDNSTTVSSLPTILSHMRESPSDRARKFLLALQILLLLLLVP